MESVNLDVNKFFKAMELVFGGGSQEQADSDDGFDRKSSSSDMDFGTSLLLVMHELFWCPAFFHPCHMASY
jgi:hypothetical protein